MDKIKVVFAGAGQRACGLCTPVICKLEDVQLVAICDSYLDKAEYLAKCVNDNFKFTPAVYTDYKKMFEEQKPDAVIISASWEAHFEIGLYALEHHIAVAMEVGGAHCEEECWKLVDTWERTKTPFMFMENCCFNKDELLATSMARNGKFGEIVYCHGAYRHELSDEIAYGLKKRHYRFNHYLNENSDNYPTHDLGPIAKLLNINRGNRMLTLNSNATKSVGLKHYCETHDEVKEYANNNWKQGDIVETMIKCENGEMITLKLDTTLPTFYSREFTVRGTKGFYVQETNTALFEGEYSENYNPLISNRLHIDNAIAYEEKYLPDMWKRGKQEAAGAGHGGMDYFEFRVFFDCLKNGTVPPIDVYDAVSWMCITYLTAQSIAKNGAPIEIPDFTRGAYKTRKPLDVCEMPVVKE